jgi:hypothetical protein
MRQRENEKLKEREREMDRERRMRRGKGDGEEGEEGGGEGADHLKENKGNFYSTWRDLRATTKHPRTGLVPFAPSVSFLAPCLPRRSSLP